MRKLIIMASYLCYYCCNMLVQFEIIILYKETSNSTKIKAIKKVLYINV